MSDNRAPRKDSSGRTFRRFVRELFEYEDCEECGQGPRNHVAELTPFGQWFARCVTPVIFRKWPKKEGGAVFALFPTIKENDGLVSSYQHVGQHGSADYIKCIDATKPAKPAQFMELKQELEAAPYHYRLRVITRWPVRVPRT